MNILADIKTPTDITQDLVARVRARRKVLGLTQRELAETSGVSYGSIKRFETTGEISLASLIKIAFALNCESDFDTLFAQQGYATIEEVINARKNARR